MKGNDRIVRSSEREPDLCAAHYGFRDMRQPEEMNGPLRFPVAGHMAWTASPPGQSASTADRGHISSGGRLTGSVVLKK
jgi:hypothetical protein